MAGLFFPLPTLEVAVEIYKWNIYRALLDKLTDLDSAGVDITYWSTEVANAPWQDC